MKKIICALLLALLLAIGAAQAEQAVCIGRWTCRSVEYNGQSISMIEFGAYVTLSLHEDGTYSMLNNGRHVQGSWAQTDSGLTISDADLGTIALTWRGEQLIMDVMGRGLCLSRDNAIRSGVAPEELAGTWEMTSVYANGVAYSQEEAFSMMGQQVELCVDSSLAGSTRRWSETEDHLFSAAFSLSELEGIGTEISIVETADNGDVIGRFTAHLLEDGRLEVLNVGDTTLYFTKKIETPAE